MPSHWRCLWIRIYRHAGIDFMKRTAIATSIVLGTTVPVLAATVFIFGCCVLPFHKLIHSVAPLCTMAAGMMAGPHDADHKNEPVPASEKQTQTVKSPTELTARFSPVTQDVSQRSLLPAAERQRFRDLISLGALRCDQDVGSEVLLQTFRI